MPERPCESTTNSAAFGFRSVFSNAANRQDAIDNGESWAQRGLQPEVERKLAAETCEKPCQKWYRVVWYLVSATATRDADGTWTANVTVMYFIDIKCIEKTWGPIFIARIKPKSKARKIKVRGARLIKVVGGGGKLIEQTDWIKGKPKKKAKPKRQGRRKRSSRKKRISG